MTSLELSVPSNKLYVWVFFPHRITEGRVISQFENESYLYHQEITKVFAELGIQWKWQPITFENMHAVVEEVAASSTEYLPVVLNYCYGDEDPNYPGTQVYKLLEAKGIPSTGADAAAIELCTSKIRMKQAFVQAGVPTAAYEIISDVNCIKGICERLGIPLIVKPAVSFDSRGISLQSVVYNDEQVISQVQRLLQGEHGMQFLPGSIFVERFVNGPEFTVFLIGSYHQPDSIKIYPPVERVFHPDLPETERFLSYDKKYKKETPLLCDKPLLDCKLVSDDLHDKLCELAKRAYCAAGGNGFGRVDIRMDKTSQELFVLEVNPTCDMTADERSSLGKILLVSGIPFSQLMTEIIAQALANYSTVLPLVSQLA